MSEHFGPKQTARNGVALALLNALCSSVLLGLIGAALAFVISGSWILVLVAVFGFGVVQVPGAIVFGLRNRDNPEKLKGLIIASSVMFLLNAGCWGLVIGHGSGRF
jgi:uncharacterized membrane protein